LELRLIFQQNDGIFFTDIFPFIMKIRLVAAYYFFGNAMDNDCLIFFGWLI